MSASSALPVEQLAAIASAQAVRLSISESVARTVVSRLAVSASATLQSLAIDALSISKPYDARSLLLLALYTRQPTLEELTEHEVAFIHHCLDCGAGSSRRTAREFRVTLAELRTFFVDRGMPSPFEL